jgi:hypothetical protein
LSLYRLDAGSQDSLTKTDKQTVHRFHIDFERRHFLEQLILLGTVHRDPDGKRRLSQYLNDLVPTAISLEVSPASVTLRRENGRRWQRLFITRLRALSSRTGLTPGELMAGSGLRGLWEYLRLPYEFRAANEYGRKNQIPVFLLDDSEPAVSFLTRVEQELLSLKNMTLLAEAGSDRPLSQDVTAEYHRAASRIYGNAPPLDITTHHREAWSSRETGLSQKLRLLHQGLLRRTGQEFDGNDLGANLIISPDAIVCMPDKVLLPQNGIHVYIGGWEHLTEDGFDESFYVRLKDLKPQRRLLVDYT